MQYYIASFVQLTAPLLQFRESYDPKADLVNPHATFVFPFMYRNFEAVDEHISSVINEQKAFPFSIKKYSISFDNHITLDFEDGFDEVHNLHDRLYTGILAPFLKKDIPFIPHITIGTVNQNGSAPNELQRLDIDVRGIIDNLCAIEITKAESPRKIKRTYKFKYGNNFN